MAKFHMKKKKTVGIVVVLCVARFNNNAIYFQSEILDSIFCPKRLGNKIKTKLLTQQQQ